MSVYFCIDLRWFELVEQAENGKMCKGCVCFNGEEFDQALCNRLSMCCHAQYSANHKNGYYVELSEEEMLKRSLPDDVVLFPPWALGLLEDLQMLRIVDELGTVGKKFWALSKSTLTLIKQSEAWNE